MKDEFLADVPAEVREKLAGLHSDVEVCKALAENGVDVLALEKKIKAAGFDLNRIGLKLADDEMEGVAGGFEHLDFGYDVEYKCGNNDIDEFSFQFFASAVDGKDWYRCKKCNTYVSIAKRNVLLYVTEQVFKDRFETKE